MLAIWPITRRTSPSRPSICPQDLADRFYIIVETDTDVDAADAVFESDETNNTRYVSISLAPLPVDLQITSAGRARHRPSRARTCRCPGRWPTSVPAPR